MDHLPEQAYRTKKEVLRSENRFRNYERTNIIKIPRRLLFCGRYVPALSFRLYFLQDNFTNKCPLALDILKIYL